MSACSIWGCSWWRADLSWIQRRALTWIVKSASVPLRRASLTCDVFLEVTVRGAPLSVLRSVGQPFPVCVFLTAHAVRAAQVGQASGRWRPLLRFHWDAAVGLLTAGVPQVLQVEGPGPELLPVDPLKGHDAVQVAAHLWIREKAMLCFQSQEHQNTQPFQLQPRQSKPFWFCAAESPSLCDECPDIRGFACSGQSLCRPTFEEKAPCSRPKDHRWKQLGGVTGTWLTFYSGWQGVSCWARQ